MNNEQKEEYSQFIQKAKLDVEGLKAELVSLTKTHCKTYGEVTRFLTKKRKETIWEGAKARVLTAIIDEVILQFEEEKGSLPVK